MEKMITPYPVLFVVCLVCHGLRSCYEILKYKNKVSPASKIVFGLMLLNMCLLWMSWFLMCETDPVKVSIPAAVRIAGLVLFIAGLVLFIYTVIRLRTLDHYQGELVRDGVFSLTRHPMYLGFIFWLIGYPVFQQSAITLLTSVLWILNVFFWRHIEEMLLGQKYPEFETYKKETWF